MLVAIVFDSEPKLAPPHVEIRDRKTAVEHRDLGLRHGETGVDEQQTEPTLSRRLCTDVDQRQQFAELTDAACRAVSVQQLRYVVFLKRPRPHQRIETGERVVSRQESAQVEGCPRRRGEGSPDTLVTSSSAMRSMWITKPRCRRRSWSMMSIG